MTPSNSHTGTAARGPRRALLLQAVCGLLAVVLVAPAPARAQSLIEFSVYTGSPWPQYEVRDDGTGLHQLAP
jgi:hypothetical protein